MSEPRSKQKDVLAYDGGTMGVSAVPGSGKTWTLTRLAARIVAEADLNARQEVLVVTLVNASVDNFASRIGALVEEEGLLPEVGYRVCTLHTLAHEIVRARPDLVGLAEDFHVIDQRARSQIISDVAQSWLRSHGPVARSYLTDDISDWKRKSVLSEKLPTQLRHIAKNAIKHAKSRELSAEALQEEITRHSTSLPLAKMTRAIYQGYQQALTVRNAVDFDDLIRYALHILRVDEELTRRLREQWPYILEDEAQDSSDLQERILRRIAGPAGNWVRVGDPNQAIYESFTTADPELLRYFLTQADERHNLPTSGRSQPSILRLANETIRWSSEEHPVEAVRSALTEPLIQPTPEGDPQPNPPDRPGRIAFIDHDYSEEREVEVVAQSLETWIAERSDKTAAVLVPTRRTGHKVVHAFEAKGLPYTDSLLKITTETRSAARKIEKIIEYLADPDSSVRLARCYLHWGEARSEDGDQDGDQGGDLDEIKRVAGLISEMDRVEDYIWPQAGDSWLDQPEVTSALQNGDAQRLQGFRERVRYWLDLSGLPIGQMVMAIAQDLFAEPDRLALAQKFAGLLRRASAYNPDWGLPELSDELRVIADNQRKFEGLGRGETEFDPDAHQGEVTISTMHGAKGLEWDRVHLLGVNDYHFPAAQAHDSFLSEKWYFRDGLNLQAETLAQIDAAKSGTPYAEGDATTEARHEYARERLRLFYVGVTRAREELIVTSNIGRFEDNEPALVFNCMKAFCDERLTAS
jgi:DNA helicase-2/ATP-dependent DNA helicase PcrA